MPESTARADAVAERAAAIERVQELGLEVSPSDLTVRKIDDTIARLRDEAFLADLSDADFARLEEAINQLENAAVAERGTFTGQVQASEHLGDVGLIDSFEAQGAEVVVRPDGVGSGQFDGVAYHAENGELIIGEAKGGSATLSQTGRLLDDGSRAAQGSTLYFNEVWRRDPAIQQLLESRPDIAAGLADGSIQVRYQLAHTAADGTVTVSDLPLDPAYLDLGLD